MLDLRVGLALDDFLDLKSGVTKVLRHFLRPKKEEINAHLVPPPFVQMNGLVTNMKSQKQFAARSEHSEKLSERPWQIGAECG